MKKDYEVEYIFEGLTEDEADALVDYLIDFAEKRKTFCGGVIKPARDYDNKWACLKLAWKEFIFEVRFILGIL